ncbi:MAG: TIGR02391 family protein [Dehalococcoidales bacterium]|nr:TIGR02391 family protein [Dehalococcoidales bacterium]
MERQRAIKLLKQKSKEAIHIAGQPYYANESVLWRRNIEDILESAFGVTSTEYKRVADIPSKTVRGTRADLQQAYVRKVHRIQQEVDSIIQKYEILGIEEKHTALKYQIPGVDIKPSTISEPKDTTELPIHLFDKMQFHTKVIESSRACFVAGNYREAILNAFISLIDYVKEKTRLDLDGDDLMNQAFSFNYDKDLGKITKYPIIRLNELKKSSDRGEQQGFMFLYKGAAGAIRNPKAHKIIPQSNPLHTLEYLAFASLLMRTVEEGAAAKPRPSKVNEEIFLARCREGGHERAVDLYLKAKALKESRYANGDFINWGVSGYSYRMPWKTYRTGETLFVAYWDGKLQIWPDVSQRKSSGEAGKKYWEKLRSIPSLAGGSKHKYPTVSTDNMKEPDIDAFIEAIEELGHGLDEISKEHKS